MFANVLIKPTASLPVSLKYQKFSMILYILYKIIILCDRYIAIPLNLNQIFRYCLCVCALSSLAILRETYECRNVLCVSYADYLNMNFG